MILDEVFSWLAVPVNALLSVLPTWTPFDFSAAGVGDTNGAMKFLGWLNFYVPLSEFIDVMALTLTLLSVVWGIKGTLWILEKLHIAGGSAD